MGFNHGMSHSAVRHVATRSLWLMTHLIGVLTVVGWNTSRSQDFGLVAGALASEWLLLLALLAGACYIVACSHSVTSASCHCCMSSTRSPQCNDCYARDDVEPVGDTSYVCCQARCTGVSDTHKVLCLCSYLLAMCTNVLLLVLSVRCNVSRYWSNVVGVEATWLCQNSTFVLSKSVGCHGRKYKPWQRWTISGRWMGMKRK